MSIDERIGRALNSTNLKNDSHHTDVDIVGALAFASELGASLHQLFTAGHLYEYFAAVRHLSNTLFRVCRRKRLGISRNDATVVARQALLEWDLKICRGCNGTGSRLLSYSAAAELEPADPGAQALERVPPKYCASNAEPPLSNSGNQQGVACCPLCDGTGMFAPLWSWRREQMNLPLDEADAEEWWAKRVDLARGIIDTAMRAASGAVAAGMR